VKESQSVWSNQELQAALGTIHRGQRQKQKKQKKNQSKQTNKQNKTEQNNT
jgi:hypothetical protein